MKPQVVPQMARALVLGALCFAAADACARAPRAREACGVVQSIDRQTRTVTLVPEKGERPRVVVWKKNTKFIKDSEFQPADALKEGSRACIFYHSPFFGKPFVTKVVWESETKSPKS